MIAFIIWCAICLVFVVLGIFAYRSKEATGFWSNVEPPKPKDVKAYNHAMARLWWVYAFVMFVFGFPLLFMKQNDPIALVPVFGVLFDTIGIMVYYTQVIYKKYC